MSSLLQEEEEEFQMVEVVDYSIQDTEQGKIMGECSKGGRADCVGLEAWTKELYRPCVDSPILRQSREYCSIREFSLLWL